MKSALHLIARLVVVLAVAVRVSFAAEPAEMAPSSNVTMGQAYLDAQFLASLHENAQVMRIEGVSMLPYFDSGSLIVVKPILEQKLRRGMVIVYRNRFGETVAHKLISQETHGWLAKGYNNEVADSTPVNAANMIGVVYATVSTSGAEASLSSIPVALAAPAR